MNEFALDLLGPSRPFYHYWELCVGSCHAATALRADWQEQLARCHRDLGFRYVRFHGLFDDDMSVAVRPLLSPEPVFCFTNIDKIYDFLLSIGMKPFVELSFMPSCLASGSKTLFHYKANTTPPRDYGAWAAFIQLFLQHLLERYGRAEVRSWYFEVWNEPNLGGPDSPFGFWSATQEEYWKLYDVTAAAVKAVDPVLRVGGPATSNNAWLPEFLTHCRQSGAPVDFVSTHHYPTDVVLGYGVEDSGNFANPVDTRDPEKLKALVDRIKSDPCQLEQVQKEYSVFRSRLWERVERDVLTDMAKRARMEVGELPLFYTEWGSLGGLPSDGAFGASFIAKTLVDNYGLVDGYSFWAFTDIFEESPQRAEAFHGGFGLLTQHGIPKAPYRAFQLLHQVEGELYDASFAQDTLEIHAFSDPGRRVVQLLAVNHQSLRHPVERQKARVALSGWGPCLGTECARVDDGHANALAAWQAMGAPEYLTEAQRLALESASCLETQPVPFQQAGRETVVEIEVPPWAPPCLPSIFDEGVREKLWISLSKRAWALPRRQC